MIVHIEAPAKRKGEAQIIANALRNSQVGQGKGALLVMEGVDAEPRHLLEKLIAGSPLPAKPVEAKSIPWKPDGMVILVGNTLPILREFEKLAPGFTKLFGPVTTLAIG